MTVDFVKRIDKLLDTALDRVALEACAVLVDNNGKPVTPELVRQVRDSILQFKGKQ